MPAWIKHSSCIWLVYVLGGSLSHKVVCLLVDQVALHFRDWMDVNYLNYCWNSVCNFQHVSVCHFVSKCVAVNTSLTHIRHVAVLKTTHLSNSERASVCIHHRSEHFPRGEKRLYGMKSALYVPNIHARVYVCTQSHARQRAPASIHTHTEVEHTQSARRVCVLRSLYWVVIVLWQCWVLLRREWRLRRRRRGRCWIDTDVFWPWQRCDTPSGSRSAPTHFLSSCPMLIVAWRFSQSERTQYHHSHTVHSKH